MIRSLRLPTSWSWSLRCSACARSSKTSVSCLVRAILRHLVVTSFWADLIFHQPSKFKVCWDWINVHSLSMYPFIRVVTRLSLMGRAPRSPSCLVWPLQRPKYDWLLDRSLAVLVSTVVLLFCLISRKARTDGCLWLVSFVELAVLNRVYLLVTVHQRTFEVAAANFASSAIFDWQLRQQSTTLVRDVLKFSI